MNTRLPIRVAWAGALSLCLALALGLCGCAGTTSGSTKSSDVWEAAVAHVVAADAESNAAENAAPATSDASSAVGSSDSETADSSANISENENAASANTGQEPVAETDKSEEPAAPAPKESVDLSSLQQATVTYVVDGDTIYVDINGAEYKVRLIGIDTPESVHPDASKNTEAGASASAHTKAILPVGTTVWLERDVSNTDKYGRLLRYVWLEMPTNPNDESEFIAKTLNAQLVHDGWAVAKRYEPDTKWADVLASL